MLTLVLLAVLALGVGLIAVFAAEQGHHATDTPELRRRRTHQRRPKATEAPAGDRESGEAADHGPVSPEPVTIAAPPPDRTAPEPVTIAAPPPGEPAPEPLTDVPRAYVAVEGAFDDIATASALRRIRSFVAVVAIVAVVGAGAAAVLGVGALLAGELLNAAIG